jgi:hypothetical protein
MDSARATPRGVGCPIRTCADQRSLATPRALSQRATSFIASWRQGIHRTPFSRARDRFRRRRRHRHRATPTTDHGDQTRPNHARARAPPNDDGDGTQTPSTHTLTPFARAAAPRAPRPAGHGRPTAAATVHSTRSSFTMPKSAPTARPRRARTRVAAERQAQEARAQRRRHRPPASPGHTGGAAARPRRSRRSSGSHPARPAAPGRCRQGRGRQAKADRRRPTDRRRMEAIGFEPTTPCLQSRRSPAELRPRRRQSQAGGTSLSAHHPAAPRLSRLSRRPCRDWLPRCRRAATSFVSPSGGFRPRQRRGRNGPGRT